MDVALQPQRQALEADVERHFAVDPLAELECDAEVADVVPDESPRRPGAQRKRGAAERCDHDVVWGDVAVAVRVT